jgi:hypothetical protein
MFPILHLKLEKREIPGTEVGAIFGFTGKDWNSRNGFRFWTFCSSYCHTTVVDFVPTTIEKRETATTDFYFISSGTRED